MLTFCSSEKADRAPGEVVVHSNLPMTLLPPLVPNPSANFQNSTGQNIFLRFSAFFSVLIRCGFLLREVLFKEK